MQGSKMTKLKYIPISDAEKCTRIMHSFTQKEKTQDTLLEVLSYLIAQRDGHGHRLNIGEAIAKTNQVLKKIDLIL